MNRQWPIFAGLTVLLLLPGIANSYPNSKIKGHNWLVSAIKHNRPPTGYIDLNNCKLTRNISDLPRDKRTYRADFGDNYTYNPEGGKLTTIMNILYQQTRDLSGTPVLMSRPATVIISSQPEKPHINYQVVMTHEGKTMMQLYDCPWDKAVFLWKPNVPSLLDRYK